MKTGKKKKKKKRKEVHQERLQRPNIRIIGIPEEENREMERRKLFTKYSRNPAEPSKMKEPRACYNGWKYTQIKAYC